MKRYFLFVLTLVLIFVFTSCKEDKSIGIIGGADGPTAVIVSK